METPSGRMSPAAPQPVEIASGSITFTYKTASGRPEWLSRDPIEEEGGINLYGYVSNDPINYWDPFGLQSTGSPSNAAKSPGAVGQIGREAVAEGRAAIARTEQLLKLAREAKNLGPKDIKRLFNKNLSSKEYHEFKKEILDQFKKEIERAGCGKNPDIKIDAEGNVVISSTGFLPKVINTGIKAINFFQ